MPVILVVVLFSGSTSHGARYRTGGRGAKRPIRGGPSYERSVQGHDRIHWPSTCADIADLTKQLGVLCRS